MSGGGHCSLFGVERCPLLCGLKCISSMVKSIGGKRAVCYTEVVCFLEGSLLKVLLYVFTPSVLIKLKYQHTNKLKSCSSH